MLIIWKEFFTDFMETNAYIKSWNSLNKNKYREMKITRKTGILYGEGQIKQFNKHQLPVHLEFTRMNNIDDLVQAYANLFIMIMTML